MGPYSGNDNVIWPPIHTDIIQCCLCYCTIRCHEKLFLPSHLTSEHIMQEKLQELFTSDTGSLLNPLCKCTVDSFKFVFVCVFVYISLAQAYLLGQIFTQIAHLIRSDRTFGTTCTWPIFKTLPTKYKLVNSHELKAMFL